MLAIRAEPFSRMRNSLLLILVLATVGLRAQQVFPELAGETPTAKQIKLPKDAKGKYTILCLAYDRSANDALTQWMEPAYLRFVAKHGLFAADHDVNIWFVPMFTGMDKAAYGPVMKKFQKSEDPEVLDHVLFFKGDIDLYVRELSMSDKSLPYIFVLDDQGRIVHSTSGAFSDDKLDALEEILPQ